MNKRTCHMVHVGPARQPAVTIAPQGEPQPTPTNPIIVNEELTIGLLPFGA
jgi:hypothetical protein